MKTKFFSTFALAFFLAHPFAPVHAGVSNGTLDIYWTDVEGGAATLIVTPAGESVLIDTGNPGGRDPGRIHKTATTVAGLKQIDHLITTHLHIDHFGGAAELAQLIPIGTVHDNGIPELSPDNASDARWPRLIAPYREFKAGKRLVIQPGEVLPLKQKGGGPKLSIRCVAAMQKVISSPDGSPRNAAPCADAADKAKDTSDNANSIVMLIQYGDFDLYVGGDLTWNIEKQLVCPVNLIGSVDVYQVTHHGLDVSNNPLVLRSLAPTVTVMSNGTSKGCGADTFATLKGTPSIQAMYQIHKNLRADSENNTAPEYIANLERDCQGHHIQLSVEPAAKSYTVSIPSSGHKRTFPTK